MVPAAADPGEWPEIEHQLAKDRIVRGSALDALVREDQDFSMLRPGEARDRIGIPLWLRVYWRRNHPEGIYSAKDPTGGYTGRFFPSWTDRRSNGKEEIWTAPVNDP